MPLPWSPPRGTERGGGDDLGGGRRAGWRRALGGVQAHVRGNLKCNIYLYTCIYLHTCHHATERYEESNSSCDKGGEGTSKVWMLVHSACVLGRCAVRDMPRHHFPEGLPHYTAVSLSSSSMHVVRGSATSTTRRAWSRPSYTTWCSSSCTTSRGRTNATRSRCPAPSRSTRP